MKPNKKILIAEDELLIAKVLRMQLEREGYEVENVVDASAAVQKAKEWQPEIIILDVYLKNGSSGIEAGKEIRKLQIDAPILFTTGNSLEATLIEIKSIANSHILTKPVEFEVLHEILNNF